MVYGRLESRGPLDEALTPDLTSDWSQPLLIQLPSTAYPARSFAHDLCHGSIPQAQTSLRAPPLIKGRDTGPLFFFLFLDDYPIWH